MLIMPLVVLCGFPGSGKSRRSKEVEELIKTRYSDKTVHIINDDYSSITKNHVYASSINEKTARADLKSKVTMKYIIIHIYCALGYFIL